MPFKLAYLRGNDVETRLGVAEIADRRHFLHARILQLVVAVRAARRLRLDFQLEVDGPLIVIIVILSAVRVHAAVVRIGRGIHRVDGVFGRRRR